MNSNHHNSFLILISVLQIFLPHVSSQASPPPGYQYADFNPSIITIIVILIAALFLMALFTVYIRRQSYDGTLSIRRALSTRRPAARGLDASVIDTFPTFVYSTVKPLKIGKGALECAVCLNEYEDEETLRLIPKCDHVFHPECIDAWLQSHVTCPVCRADLLAVVPEVREQNDDVSENNVVVDIQEQVTQTDRGLDQEDDSVKLNSPSIIPRVYFERFRSHSTGHSVVQPGENMDRFTLRLPADVRKQVVNRALLNRERSGKSGYRTGGAISGRRKGFKRLESLDRVMLRSERWVLSRAPSFLSRALSFRSPRVVSGNGDASTSSTTPKMVDKIPLNNFGPKSC